MSKRKRDKNSWINFIRLYNIHPTTVPVLSNKPFLIAFMSGYGPPPQVPDVSSRSTAHTITPPK